VSEFGVLLGLRLGLGRGSAEGTVESDAAAACSVSGRAVVVAL